MQTKHNMNLHDKHFNKIELGYDESEVSSYKDMEKYYSTIDQNKYGVLGIKIEV